MKNSARRKMNADHEKALRLQALDDQFPKHRKLKVGEKFATLNQSPPKLESSSVPPAKLFGGRGKGSLNGVSLACVAGPKSPLMLKLKFQKKKKVTEAEAKKADES